MNLINKYNGTIIAIDKINKAKRCRKVQLQKNDLGKFLFDFLLASIKTKAIG